jgi:hypothetical protein
VFFLRSGRDLYGSFFTVGGEKRGRTVATLVFFFVKFHSSFEEKHIKKRMQASVKTKPSTGIRRPKKAAMPPLRQLDEKIPSTKDIPRYLVIPASGPMYFAVGTKLQQRDISKFIGRPDIPPPIPAKMKHVMLHMDSQWNSTEGEKNFRANHIIPGAYLRPIEQRGGPYGTIVLEMTQPISRMSLVLSFSKFEDEYDGPCNITSKELMLNALEKWDAALPIPIKMIM